MLSHSMKGSASSVLFSELKVGPGHDRISFRPPEPEHRCGPAYLIRYMLRDLLTQLPNRATFINNLDAALEKSRLHADCNFTLLCIGMDRFKIINESLGFERGDELLVGASERIARIMRGNETLARLGGDKFAVLIDNANSTAATETAVQLAREIQNELSAPLLVGRYEVFASASVGIAPVSASYANAEAIVRDAEIAMYRAKNLGKSHCVVFDSTIDSRHATELELEMDLRHAIKRNEFELYYQPIVSAATGKFAAYEALIRWRHPSRGLLQPGAFLRLLNDTGLIVSAGRWVFEQVCRQAREWERAAGRIISVSLNLSAPEFGAPGLVNAISQTMNETGVNPESLTVEITEGALVAYPDGGEDTLSALSGQGLRLLIDDFGTGYSSLSYLGRLPVRGLKIPRELVSRIDRHAEDRAIVHAIAALSQVLGLDVVAEGVENREQLAELRAMECHHVQGYLISPPVNAITAGEMLGTDGGALWGFPERH
jgi:diguanylate cyclase (GGDEF)-like protein